MFIKYRNTWPRIFGKVLNDTDKYLHKWITIWRNLGTDNKFMYYTRQSTMYIGK